MAEDFTGKGGELDQGIAALGKALGALDDMVERRVAAAAEGEQRMIADVRAAEAARTSPRAAAAEAGGAEAGTARRIGAMTEAEAMLARSRATLSAAGPEFEAFIAGQRKRYAELSDPDFFKKIQRNAASSLSNRERALAKANAKASAPGATDVDVRRRTAAQNAVAEARQRTGDIRAAATANAIDESLRSARELERTNLGLRDQQVELSRVVREATARAGEIATPPRQQAATQPGAAPQAAAGGAGGGAAAPPPTARGGAEPDDGAARRASQEEERLANSLRAREAATVRARAAHQAMTVALDQSSNSMRSNGAMSQQFIQAAARGEASWREWGYQVSTVTAKFGAWALAGGAVYSMFDGIRRVGTGAIAGAGIEGGLGRVIDNLDTDKAQQSIRDLSRTYNVSMSEAEEAVQLGAQQFNNLDGAVQAARATLSSFKVGDLGIQEGSTYINAIAGGLGLASNEAGKLQGIFDQINEAQNSFNVSIPDTQKGLAKSVGTFSGAGGDFTDLLALITTGKRVTGRTGENVGTALQRSVGFIERPTNQRALESLGIDTSQGVSETFNQAFQRATEMIQQGNRAGVRDIAQALSSPQYASYLEPILANEPLYRRAQQGLSNTPGNAQGSGQRELDKQLSRFGERLSGVGNGLERLGAALAQSGLLNILGLAVVAFSGLLNATTDVLEIFNNLLPGGIRNVVTGLVAFAAVLAIARRQAPAQLVRQSGPVGRLLGSSENATLKREIGRTLRLQQKDLSQELVAAQRDGTKIARRQLATSSELEGVANTRTAAITSGRPVDPAVNARYQHLVEEQTRLTNAQAAANNRINVATRELTIVDQQLAKATDARTLAARRALAAEANIALSPTKDRPSTDPLVSRTRNGYVEHDPLRERAAASERARAADAAAREAIAAPPTVGPVERDTEARYRREYAAKLRALEAEAAGGGRAYGPITRQQDRDQRFSQMGLWQRAQHVVGAPGGAADAARAARNAYGEFGGVTRVVNGTSTAARSLATNLRGATRGLADMIGPIGLAIAAFQAGKFALDAVADKRKDALATADRIVTSDPNNFEDIRRQQEEDRRIIADRQKRRGPLTQAFRSFRRAGDVDYEAALAREQRLATDVATVRTRNARSGAPNAVTVDEVTNRKGTGYVDALVKEQRAGVIDPDQLRKGIAIAEKQLQYVLGDAKTREEAMRKLGEFDAALAASLPKTALLGDGGLAETDLAAVQNQAANAAAAIGTGFGTSRDASSSIRSNTALLATAASKAANGGAGQATALKEMLDARKQLTEDAISFATDGLDQQLALTRDQGSRNGAYGVAESRLRKALSSLSSNPDRARLEKQLRDRMKEEAEARKALKDLDSGAPSETREIDILGNKVEIPVDRDTLLKRVTTAAQGMKDTTAALDAVNQQTAYAGREIRAKLKELENARFEENEGLIASQVAAAASGAQRGMPTSALNARAAHDAYVRAVRFYGRNTKEALDKLAAYNAAQDQEMADALALVQSENALAEARVSGGTAQQQAAAAVTSAQRTLDATRADPRASQAEVNNAMAAVISARNQQSQAVADDTNAYIRAMGDYRKSLTSDPIRQAAIDAQTAQELLQKGQFKNPSDRLSARADANNARRAAREAVNQGKYDDIEFQASIGKLTATQEIKELDRLLRTRKLTRALRRQIQQKIYQLKNEANENSDSFNLNVGDLSIPSIAQIRRAVVGRNQGVSVTNQNRATVYVNRPEDIPGVARVLEEHNMGVGRAQQRAMGVA